ncbi:MAG: CU044_2847 family protein [Cyanobacteria bacterium P01_F01_bin.13]
MAEIRPFSLQDADGNTYNILIESTAENVPDIAPSESDDEEEYGLVDDAKAHLKKVHGTIRAYSWYAIGAFRNAAKHLPGTKVEEVTLKFGMSLGGEAGLPIFTKGSVESNFEVEVKCTFPEKD